MQSNLNYHNFSVLFRIPDSVIGICYEVEKHNSPEFRICRNDQREFMSAIYINLKNLRIKVLELVPFKKREFRTEVVFDCNRNEVHEFHFDMRSINTINE